MESGMPKGPKGEEWEKYKEVWVGKSLVSEEKNESGSKGGKAGKSVVKREEQNMGDDEREPGRIETGS